MFNFREIRTLPADRLRRMCINYNFCTRMDNEEYDNFLKHYNSLQNVTTKDIEDCVLILEECSKVPSDMQPSDIAWAIINEACITRVEVVE